MKAYVENLSQACCEVLTSLDTTYIHKIYFFSGKQWET